MNGAEKRFQDQPVNVKKKEKKKNETEKRLPCDSLLGGVGVVFWMLVPPLGGRCGYVGAGCLGGTSRATAS
jgi:hypothetical protein